MKYTEDAVELKPPYWHFLAQKQRCGFKTGGPQSRVLPVAWGGLVGTRSSGGEGHCWVGPARPHVLRLRDTLACGWCLCF